MAKSRLLPPSIVSSELYICKQRLQQLIDSERIQSETIFGVRLVVVRSALIYAKKRYRHRQQRKPLKESQ